MRSLWDCIKDRAEYENPRTIRPAIYRCWEDMRGEPFDIEYAGMHRRMEEVVLNDGGSIEH